MVAEIKEMKELPLPDHMKKKVSEFMEQCRKQGKSARQIKRLLLKKLNVKLT